LKTILNKISKKNYISPTVTKIQLDNTISLNMLSFPDEPPPPPGMGKKGNDDPFESPFGDSPFK
jgi:hypothetical protein